MDLVGVAGFVVVVVVAVAGFVVVVVVVLVGLVVGQKKQTSRPTITVLTAQPGSCLSHIAEGDSHSR